MKLRYFAAAAAIALPLGIGTAAAGTAHAATPSCGSSCLDVFSHDFGTFAQPQFLLDVYKRSQAVGAPVILFRASNSDPAEDWTVADQGTVADFFEAGLVSPQVALHYGCTTPAFPVCAAPVSENLQAYELEYAPYGADTGLCAGTATAAANGAKISLQPCGTSSRTVWIDAAEDSPSTISVPLINGSDTNFSHPYVATYPGGSYPTDVPRAQLYTSQLTGFSNGSGPVLGSVSDTQLWAWDTGSVF